MDNVPVSPASPNSPAPGAPSTNSPKKQGLPVVIWVLLGCGGLVLLGILLFAAFGFFVWKKASNAVHVEDGKVTLRDGKGGTVTVNTDNKDRDRGAVTIKSNEGTVTFGAGADATVPAWMPRYPGSNPQPLFSMKTDKGDQVSCSFETADSPAQVKDFYNAQLKSLGFNINKGGYQMDTGQIQTVTTTAQHTDGRQVTVTAIREEGQDTKVSLMLVTNK